MSNMMPSKEKIENHFRGKYGDPDFVGWGPKRRFRYGHVLAGDMYECFLDNVVIAGQMWVDVGGGRSVLPHNKELSLTLSNRCSRLVSVDPSENVKENPYCHLAVKSSFENFNTDERFDLATFRMVAEHIENPFLVVEKLDEILKSNGLVVIYTINKFSPIPIITKITPFSWHYVLKSFIWGGDEKDTFPVSYKMNTRKDLDRLFLRDKKFELVEFHYIDDTSSTINFKHLNMIELNLWRIFRRLKLRYFENNLLAVYRKVN